MFSAAVAIFGYLADGAVLCGIFPFRSALHSNVAGVHPASMRCRAEMECQSPICSRVLSISGSPCDEEQDRNGKRGARNYDQHRGGKSFRHAIVGKQVYPVYDFLQDEYEAGRDLVVWGKCQCWQITPQATALGSNHDGYALSFSLSQTRFEHPPAIHSKAIRGRASCTFSSWRSSNPHPACRASSTTRSRPGKLLQALLHRSLVSTVCFLPPVLS